MPKTPEKPRSGALESSSTDYQALLKSNGETFEALFKANESMLEGMTALSRELFDFGNRRLRQEMELSEKLLQCQDAEEAFEISSSFAQRTTEQYLAEANRIFEIATSVSRKCWAPLEHRTRDVLHDIEETAAEAEKK
jgi:hypothetical protein